MDPVYPDEYDTCLTCGAETGMSCLDLRSLRSNKPIRLVSRISRPHHDRELISFREQRDRCRVRMDNITVSSMRLGHEVTWNLGENAMRQGYEYYWAGYCKECDSGVHVTPSFSIFFGSKEVGSTPCNGFHAHNPDEEWLTWLQGPRPVGL